MSVIDPLPGSGGGLEHIHMDVHVIIHPGFFLSIRRSQHPAQVLDHPPAEPDRRCQKKRGQRLMVKALPDQLPGCDEDADFSLIELITDGTKLSWAAKTIKNNSNKLGTSIFAP